MHRQVFSACFSDYSAITWSDAKRGPSCSLLILSDVHTLTKRSLLERWGFGNWQIALTMQVEFISLSPSLQWNRNHFSTQSVPVFYELSCKVRLVTFVIVSLLWDLSFSFAAGWSFKENWMNLVSWITEYESNNTTSCCNPYTNFTNYNIIYTK